MPKSITKGGQHLVQISMGGDDYHCSHNFYSVVCNCTMLQSHLQKVSNLPQSCVLTWAKLSYSLTWGNMQRIVKGRSIGSEGNDLSYKSVFNHVQLAAKEQPAIFKRGVKLKSCPLVIKHTTTFMKGVGLSISARFHSRGNHILST